MRVFLTGATGFVGSRVLNKLLLGGHEVVGLARSDAAAEALVRAGARVHRGNLTDLESLHVGAANADAVIHTAFDHNFRDYPAYCEQDRQAIMAMGQSLSRFSPLIITSGTAMGEFATGAAASEAMFNPNQANPRKASELAANVLLDAGRDVRIMRLPQIHNTARQGLLNPYIDWARRMGVAAYVGDGDNRWAAAHVDDVAELYVRVLERGTIGQRYNAVAEEGVVARDAIEVIAKGLGLPMKSVTPRDAIEVFDWLTMFVGSDLPASSTLTRLRVDWQPKGPSLLDDLRARDYSRNPQAA